MSGALAGIISRFPGMRVAVIGDAMLDSYIDGHSDRLCQEAPVPIIDVHGSIDAAGGAANTAANAAALGARASLIALRGNDEPGERLQALLEAAGVDAGGFIAEADRETLWKRRISSSGQLIARLDCGSIGPAARDAERVIAERLRSALAASDAVVVSDYGYGVMTPLALEELARARRSGKLVVDAKDLRSYARASADAVKPNYRQATELAGVEPAWNGVRASQMEQVAPRLLDAAGARMAAVTLDVDGAILIERGEPPYRTYARARAQSRAAGAGDTFAAALGMALAAGANATIAAEIASAAASVAVAGERTSVCGIEALRARLQLAASARLEAAELAPRLEAERWAGRRIVFTNGCFDIIHRGHVTYLNRARELGDVLVVGVNSDSSVRRLKGDGRPVNQLEDRLHVLEALSCVDYAVAFDEDTPVDLIRALKPDVFVKGGDYTLRELPEAAVVTALGGSVRILDYVESRSTTGIIERIRGAEPRRNGLARRMA